MKIYIEAVITGINEHEHEVRQFLERQLYSVSARFNHPEREMFLRFVPETKDALQLRVGQILHVTISTDAREAR